MSAKISIIIPNWNGRAFLKRCVGSILQSAAEHGAPYECFLMDDASTDSSADDIEQAFKLVRVIRHQTNLGFGAMINEGARIATGDILLLVNSDLIASAGFVSHLCSHFSANNRLFGVSAKTIDWDRGDINHQNMQGTWIHGEFQLLWSDSTDAEPTHFLQGGSCAIRRSLFLELGGFCPLFAPGYWEDYDLSFLALKAGYENLYDPRAQASHLGQGSMIRAYGHERIAFIKERNHLLFQALNFTGILHDEFWNGLPRYVRSAHSRARFLHRFRAFQYLWTNRHAIAAERRIRAEREVISDAELLCLRAEIHE